jgi:hypothetical protein
MNNLYEAPKSYVGDAAPNKKWTVLRVILALPAFLVIAFVIFMVLIRAGVIPGSMEEMMAESSKRNCFKYGGTWTGEYCNFERKAMKNYLHPWNLTTLAIGIALLIVGRYYYNAMDWDVPISLIMAALAYAFATWSLRVVLERQWRMLPLALLATWFTIDGSYAIYWYFVDPVALEMMRGANFPASLALYGACAIVWLAPELRFEFRLRWAG